MGKKIIGRPCKENVTNDFMRMGVIKRKLTRKEARQITDDIVKLGITDPDLRFRLAVIKTIEITNKQKP